VSTEEEGDEAPIASQAERPEGGALSTTTVIFAVLALAAALGGMAASQQLQ